MDATGAAWWGPNALVFDKAPVPASRYRVKLGKDTSTAVLHTRLATQGSPKRNRNNHPIPVGERGKRLVGVHNGVIYNDDGLFKDLTIERHAEVDSEAVFAYLYQHGPRPQDLKDVWGSYALGYLKEDEPNTLYLCRGCDSPLIVAKCKHGWVFASTARTLEFVEGLVGGWVKKGGPASYTEGMFGVYHEGRELEYASFKYYQWGSYGNRYRSCSANTSRMTPATLAWQEWEDWEYPYPTLGGGVGSGCAEGGTTKPEYFDDADVEEVAAAFGDPVRGIPNVGYDERVKAGAQWLGSYLDTEDERFYYHCYDDGSMIRNMSVMPPFRYCSLLSRVHANALSGDEEEARRSTVVDLLKKGSKR